MNDDANCLVKIQGLLPSLRGVSRRTAQYVLQNPRALLNQPIAKTAEEIGVAESSIIRFCRMLGYSGFASFKISLASSIQTQSAFRLDDLSISAFEPTEPWQTLKCVFAQTTMALEQTVKLLSPAAFSKAADLIVNAGSLTFFGIGTSAPIAEDACYRFLRLRRPVSCAVDPYAMLLAANNLKAGCAAVGISHTGRSRETIRALKKAREQGASAICITSYPDSPITKYADVSLVTSAAESQVIHEAVASRIAHISLLDSLYTFAVLRDYEKASAGLRDVNDMMYHARQ